MSPRKITDDQEESFIVVDKNDKVIGQATRRECHHNRGLIHRGVTILIFNVKGELFLQKRSDTKDLWPGCWSTSAGGHLTSGETYQEAAKKETKEELGVKPPIKKVGKFFYQGKVESEMITAYKGVSNGPFKLNRDEIEKGRFFDLNDLSKKAKSGEVKLTPKTEYTLGTLRLI